MQREVIEQLTAQADVVVPEQARAAAIHWPDVRPLPSDMPSVLPFESSLLPPILRAFVDDVAERLQCPPDFTAVAIVVVVGAAIGRRCGLRPKRHDDWLVVPNLWGAGIGRPSLLKTPAITAALHPLQRLEAEARERYDAEMMDFDKQEVLAKAKRKDLDRQLAVALKKGQEVLSVLSALDGGDPNPPVRQRYITNDATVEKLGEILADNPAGVLQFRDELIGLLVSLDKENQQGARAFYLEAWNGIGRYTYDRIGRGTIDIESATVSVLGGIQPGRLGPYVRGAVSGGAGDDGLIQRFQLMVWPDAPAHWRNIDRWPDTRARDAVLERLRRLVAITAESVGAEVDAYDKHPIPFLRFTPEAQEVFDAWRSDLELRLRSGQEHPAFESHLGKYRSLVPALALVFHLVEHEHGPVEEAAVLLAVRWATYLESHARRVYSAATAAEVVAARAIWSHVARGDLLDGFDARAIYRKGWTGLSDADDVKGGLELLVEYGYLVESIDPPTAGASGRPRHPRYLVNPAARNQKTPHRGTDRTDKTSSVGSVSGVPGDRDAYEERMAVCTVDGGLTEEEAETIAQMEAAGWLCGAHGGYP